MNELVNNILNYIDTNLDNEINIDILSSEFNYDKFYIMKLFKEN